MRIFSVVLAAALLANAATAAKSHQITPVQGLVHSRMDNWHDTKRLLRAVDSEERGFSAPNVEMLQGWFKKGLISDEAVGLLSLGNKADDLLTGSLLNAWVSYINVFNKENPSKKMKMISTLTARFGDEALSTMVETAKRIPKTEAIATQVQAKQIKNWMKAGETPDDVFELLKLNTAKSLLFDRPPVNTWLKYMDEFTQSNAGSQFSTIATLRKIYTDDELAEMIIVAAKNSKTSDAGKRVETELLRTWFNEMKTPTDILRLLNRRTPGQTSLASIWTKYVDLFNKVDPRFKTDMLEDWLKKGLITEDTFKLLTLGNAADDLLNGSMLSAWVTYIKVFNQENPTQKMSLLATLTARFGDEAVSTMVETAKRAPKTKDIASKVQAEQIQNWKKLGKNPDDVFELLKLNTAKSLLFDQPPVNTWLKYMDDFRKTNTGSQFSTIATLRKIYTDDELAEMILIAAKNSKTSDAGKRVETELLRTWFNEMKTPTDILRLLNRRTPGQTSLASIWTKYVDLFNKVDPRFKTDMLEDWLKKGLITEDTFKLLTLGNAADDLLNGSMLSAWVTYIKVFNQENPTQEMSLLATLTARFGDEAVSTMLEAAKKMPKTARIANSVQKEQIRHWLSTKKLPDDVFVLLKLNTAKTRLFDQPQLNTWVRYVDAFNDANPASKTTLFSTLTTRYNEATLAQMLVVARTSRGSARTTAIRIQAEQTKFWLSVKRTPDDIFKMLQLKKLGTNFLTNPIFLAWVKYTDDFRKNDLGTHLSTLTTLRKYHSDETLAKLFTEASKKTKTTKIGRRLEAELLREWSLAGTSPVQVFSRLNLRSTGRKMLESPVYTMWTNYIAMFKKANPRYTEGQLATLIRSFGHKELSMMLISAEKVQSTTDIATRLRAELFDLWRASKVDPAGVYKMLHVENAAANSPTRTFWSEYVKVYTNP
ncbi:hypothetical protein PC110_g16700 [Phytophthora cactorum]|uniref:RxLR effector PexRD54 WY domain-containing protein n=1 Tax=Phytophthora cactorum TaxID=29920 RepID=A0A329RRE5_9STRA|nr:hypothetical protein PC110_g16700 [Phytophthora cactorum]